LKFEPAIAKDDDLAFGVGQKTGAFQPVSFQPNGGFGFALCEIAGAFNFEVSCVHMHKKGPVTVM